jgi:hypothetical protein
MSVFKEIIEKMNQGKIENLSVDSVNIYKDSYASHEGTRLLMVKHSQKKFILASGQGALYDAIQGREEKDFKICDLTHENRLVLNQYFDYTTPKAFGTQVATIGLGDRLGLAAPGHIKTVLGKDVKPILAQQSIRELNLTGRNYKEVIDAACFGVFEQGYKGGFGADGDHLKVEEDIQMSLDLGFTMLTLDCSEKIDNTIEGSSEDEIKQKYDALDDALKAHYESRYLDQSFDVLGQTLTFSKINLMKNVLIYHEAIEFMDYIFQKYIKNASRTIDFEISIDETLTPTEPESHYLVANELYDRKMTIFSMAPRFCGEFQKGIDYIGDIAQFEKEMVIHAAIADHSGYKLSIHSGSDKFSVFPIIAKYTKGRFHVKTAGTNWLEAVRSVAKVNPDLYRRMHQFALDHVEEALAYYHVSADFKAILPLDEAKDGQLPDYMDEDNARQLIHITYGLLLQAKNENMESLFKEEFYATLSDHEEAYEKSLIKHIGKHLELLGK